MSIILIRFDFKNTYKAKKVQRKNRTFSTVGHLQSNMISCRKRSIFTFNFFSLVNRNYFPNTYRLMIMDVKNNENRF